MSSSRHGRSRRSARPDRWLAELDSSVNEARATVAETVRRWQAEHHRVDEVMALRRWVRQFPEVAIYQHSSSSIPGFRSLNGEPLHS